MADADDDTFPLLEREDALVEELRLNVPKALKEWDEEAIHAARVATRRLKAALTLMKPVLSSDQHKPFGGTLRKLRRRLGPLRDLDVMITHLQEMRPRNQRLGPALVWLIEQLQQSRVAAREHSQKRASAGHVLARLGTWWDVREEVLAAHEAIDSLIAEQLHLQLDSFAERADRLVGASTHAGPPKQPAIDPHELRIAGKSLRYTLEMAELEGHELPKKITKAFKKMQESLGLWHDYVVLSERVMQLSLEALLPHHNAPLQADVLDVAKNLLGRSTTHLKEFASLWSLRGPELSASIRQHFPLSRPVSATDAASPVAPEATPIVAPPADHVATPAPAPLTAPKTDPDPPDSAETPAPAAPVPDAASVV